MALALVLRAPNGIRTRAAALKGRCPGPLDDEGGMAHGVHAVGDQQSIGEAAPDHQSRYVSAGHPGRARAPWVPERDSGLSGVGMRGVASRTRIGRTGLGGREFIGSRQARVRPSRRGENR
jgi:hypothetical protein